MSSSSSNEGIIGCVSERLQTKTITRSTGTVKETIPTIITTSITSYLWPAESTGITPISPTDMKSGTKSIDASYSTTTVEEVGTSPSAGTSAETTTDATTTDAITTDAITTDAITTDAITTDAITTDATTTDATTYAVITSAATTSAADNDSMATNSATTAAKDDTRPVSQDSETANNDSVFVSHATRTTAPLATILTISVVSTLAVTRTVTAECTSA
jgi:hypothetical protein